MKYLLVLAFIAVAAVSYISPEAEEPRYREVGYSHTVQYGENVHDIARKYIDLHAGKDYARFVFAIQYRNGLLEGRRLHPGMQIYIPCLKRVN